MSHASYSSEPPVETISFRDQAGELELGKRYGDLGGN